MTRLLCLLAVLVTTTAEAQTYIRPSKGKVLDVLSVTSAVAAGVDQFTSYLDMTAFSAATISLNYAGTSVDNCTLAIEVQGTTDPTKPVVPGIINDPNSYRIWLPFSYAPPSFAYNVSNLPPYIRLRVVRLGTGCVFPIPVQLTPLPFNYRQEVSGSSPANSRREALGYQYELPVVVAGLTDPLVSAPATNKQLRVGNGTRVMTRYYAAAGGRGYRSVIGSPLTVGTTSTVVYNSNSPVVTLGFQNQSTQPVYCNVGTGAAPTPTSYLFVLAPSAAPSDGTAPIVQLPFSAEKNSGRYNCVVSTGTSKVSVFTSN